ncbi:MAG: DUF2142 domain-containing protein [Ignavibacteriae bacterium]|nr:DUF2142 domain-containing protein [Ignavibacteriota bacterium]
MIRNHKIIFILLYFVVFSATFSFIVPVFESPDENLHLQYINYVTKYKKLPDQYEGMVNKEKFVGQGHQHPLYYVITGFLNYTSNNGKMLDIKYHFNKLHVWNGGNLEHVPYFYNIRDDVFDNTGEKYTFYLLRILSVIFGALNVLFIYKIGKIITDNENFSLFAAFIAASLPQFAFISGMINNDNLANLMSTICLFLIIKIFKEGYSMKQIVLLGIALGISVLTKKTLMFLLPGIVLMFLYKSVVIDKEYKGYFKYVLVILLLTVLITGWYFARNIILYNDILGTRMEIDTMPTLVDKKSLFSYYFVSTFPRGLFISFVGLFGWMNLKPPSYIHLLYIFFALAAFYGFAKSKIIKEKHLFNTVILMSAFVFICFCGIIYFNLTFTQYQGRYMFPVLSLIVVILSLGLKYFAGVFSSNLIRKVLTIGVIAILFLFDIICLIETFGFYNTPSNYL